jgi:amino acid transporter
VVGWVAYVSAIASSAAVLVGLTTAVGPAIGIDGEAGRRAAATFLAALIASLCARGLRLSARTWTALTVLKLLPLLALALVYAFSPGSPSAVAAPSVPVVGIEPSWGAAALIATFAYQGFEIVPVLAGQARRPAVSVPLATVGSLAIAAVLYVVLQAACASALPHLAASRAPLVEAAAVHGGPWLAAFVGAGTSLSALGIAFAMMAATPFYLAALARVDGLGLGLAAVDARGVATRALLVTWSLVTLLIQAGGRGELFALSSIAVLSQYLVTAAALLALALRRQRGLTGRHAALAIPAGIVAFALAAGASRREALTAAAALLVGLAIRAAIHRRPRAA